MSMTFETLCAIAPGALDDKEKKRVDESVERLSQNNLDAWRQVGPGVQTALVSAVSAFEPDERKRLFPVIVSVCRQALEAEVTGTSTALDTFTFHRGAVVVSNQLIATRRRALNVLQTLYADAEHENQRRTVFTGMLAATHTPSGAHPRIPRAVRRFGTQSRLRDSRDILAVVLGGLAIAWRRWCARTRSLYPAWRRGRGGSFVADCVSLR
jgi:hypothetical protein